MAGESSSRDCRAADEAKQGKSYFVVLQKHSFVLPLNHVQFLVNRGDMRAYQGFPTHTVSALCPTTKSECNTDRNPSYWQRHGHIMLFCVKTLKDICQHENIF